MNTLVRTNNWFNNMFAPIFGEKTLGYPIQIDWPLTLILLFTIWSSAQESLTKLVTNLLLFFGVYGSILLHELAHAYVAKKFKMETDHIKIHAFGGYAKIDKLGEDNVSPKAEFWIAFAGPLANFGIWLLIFLSYFIVAKNSIDVNLVLDEKTAVNNLLFTFANIQLLLVLYNLLPIYPLDGGRILRASLHYFTKNFHKSTRIANYISIIICAAILIYCIVTFNWIGAAIMVFVMLTNIILFYSFRIEAQRLANLPKHLIVSSKDGVIDGVEAECFYKLSKFTNTSTKLELLSISKINMDSDTLNDSLDINKVFTKLKNLGYVEDVFDATPMSGMYQIKNNYYFTLKEAHVKG